MANEFFRAYGPDAAITISPRGQAIRKDWALECRLSQFQTTTTLQFLPARLAKTVALAPIYATIGENFGILA